LQAARRRPQALQGCRPQAARRSIVNTALIDQNTYLALSTVGAVLGVVAHESSELLAHGTVGLLALLARLGVLHHALHLGARQTATVCVATLTRVHKRLDASLQSAELNTTKKERQCSKKLGDPFR
jgi:hypothetical protein